MSAGHKDAPRDTTCQSGAVFFSNPLMSDVESNWSPIHDAAFNGRILILQRLIAEGACVNLSTLDGVSPLHGACVQGHTACAKLLMENGANVNTSTVDGQTPLTEACARGHLTCVLLLLHHGANSRGTDQSDSAIHKAAAKGQSKCIKLLVQHGADVDHHIGQLGTPLQVACSNQHLGAARTLLQLGAGVNRSVSGDSPLHFAARSSGPRLVSLLLDHGADRFLLNSEGKRALELAPPDSPVEKLLREAGGVFHLMQLCRLHIRKTAGTRRLSRIRDLHLPKELIQYLLYQSDPGGIGCIGSPQPLNHDMNTTVFGQQGAHLYNIARTNQHEDTRLE